MRTWKAAAVPLAVLLAITGTAMPASAEPPPASSVAAHATQPVFSRADAIVETVYVEVAGVDSDFDRRPDRVAVDIMRPRETERGLKVPVIMEASPYYAGGNDVQNHDVDIEPDEEGRSGSRTARNKLADLMEAGVTTKSEIARAEAGPFDSYYDNYFVPRGYAVALVENLGSGRATGCPTTGDRNETLGPKAAIDWLNGRARGFDADGNRVRADWTTGKVGMIGVSYNGTLPNAVAATGVDGLKTIVPIAAISSWYDYYRANGGVLAPGGFQGEDADVLAKYVLTRADGQAVCGGLIDRIGQDQDRLTGDYSDFWDDRNYLNDVRRVKASVFLVHGLNDWNVKTKQAAQWWDALAEQGTPRKIWLHQGAHTSPFNVRTAEWLRQLHGWFDYWLYGIQNGIMREPQADVEFAPGQWGRHASWPLPRTRDVSTPLDSLGSRGARSAHDVDSFVDQRTRRAEELAAEPETADANRLAYLSPVLKDDLRISGTPTIKVRASLEGGRSPYLTALLVDYGSDTRATGALRSTGEELCYGQGVPGDTGCTILRQHVTETAPFKIVTRGWLDTRNRNAADRTEPLRPGRAYDFRWDFQAQDYVFKAGHRLGVVLISTDYDYTLRYPAGTVVKVQPERSVLSLPVAEGRL
ncbi:Xaa-Pro dipeptidyl-peptidase [Microtetraspora sp. NBRC 13810]|uniref:Xaa-Pro dipeptidyl-peptidase n=1 Tax=Microtetraspora sp. NBRC 13810 TaxID=3030990 RepID=UPI0024A4A64C|nr:Xaa-Pro dipeptidyl-peptidase [Microtetraspora sp. NBRC 13810]GLW05486.1 Xaa-Pro dipeptidyl-peptidase [Microtetraspora sp. NBRC 13810]